MYAYKMGVWRVCGDRCCFYFTGGHSISEQYFAKTGVRACCCRIECAPDFRQQHKRHSRLTVSMRLKCVVAKISQGLDGPSETGRTQMR